MKKHYVSGEIVKSTENGVTVIRILGLEDHPKAYKKAYEQVQQQISKNMIKLISRGAPVPVIRAYPSLEIH